MAVNQVTLKDVDSNALPLNFPEPGSKQITTETVSDIDVTNLDVVENELSSLEMESAQLSDEIYCGILEENRSANISDFNRRIGFSNTSKFVLQDPPAGLDTAMFLGKLKSTKAGASQKTAVSLSGLVTLMTLLNLAGSSWSLDQVTRKVWWDDALDSLKGKIVVFKYNTGMALLANMYNQKLTKGEHSSDLARVTGWIYSASLYQTYCFLVAKNNDLYGKLFAMLPKVKEVYSRLKAGEQRSEFTMKLLHANQHLGAFRSEDMAPCIEDMLANPETHFDVDFVHNSARRLIMERHSVHATTIRREVNDVAAVLTTSDPMGYIKARGLRLNYLVSVNSIYRAIQKRSKADVAMQALGGTGGQQHRARRG